MRKEQIKEEIITLRDDNKHGFIVLMALATASVTVLFQVLVGDIKAVFFIFGDYWFYTAYPCLYMDETK